MLFPIMEIKAVQIDEISLSLLKNESPKCQKCFLLPVCGGGCPYSRIQNEYEGTDISTCLFMKNHLKDFLLAHANYKNQKCNSK